MPLTMKLDGNKFTLSNQALEAIATTFWRTRVKERGRMLCQDDQITAGEEHIGGPASITARNCRGKPPVGDFHTHPPPSPSAPSWWDAFSILSNSYHHNRPALGCRGAKADGLIRCETARQIPTLAELAYLKAKRPRMRYTWAESDPEIAKYLSESHSFEVRKVPEIIKPPAPPPVAPRIKTEELVFAGSMFKRYTNLDTGETRVERIY